MLRRVGRGWSETTKGDVMIEQAIERVEEEVELTEELSDEALDRGDTVTYTCTSRRG